MFSLWNRAQVRARPGEFISLADNNPGAFIILAQAEFDGVRNFYGPFGAKRTQMGDR